MMPSVASVSVQLVYAREDHVEFHQYIDDLQLAMNAIGDDLHAAFFAKAAISPLSIFRSAKRNNFQRVGPKERADVKIV